MDIGQAADDAFAYLRKTFGEDYVEKNRSAALRFAGDWLIATGNDDVAQAILQLQDVLFVSQPMQPQRQGHDA